MKIIIPGEPIPKARPRKGQHGNFYTPRQTVEYESTIAWSCKAQPDRFGSSKVAVHTIFFFSSERSLSDGDNCHKSVLDALQLAGIFSNDRQVREGHYYMRVDQENPRTEIIVQEIFQELPPASLIFELDEV